MVITHLDKKYNTLYSASTMRELLYRIGFSSKKPHISLKRGMQNRFKKTQKGQLKNTATLDVSLLCLDESTNKIAPNIQRGWYLTGNTQQLKSTTLEKSFNPLVHWEIKVCFSASSMTNQIQIVFLIL